MFELLGLSVGILLGLIIGEAIEDKKYKVAAGILGMIFSSAIGTFIVKYPTVGNAIGAGLLVGFILSIWYEPIPRSKKNV